MKRSHIGSLFFLMTLHYSLEAMDEQSVVSQETCALIELLLAPSGQLVPSKPLEVALKKKPALLQDMLKPLSHFKQQLSYHDRLTVDVATKKIIIDEALDVKRRDRLNFLATQLVTIAKKREVSTKLSSWVSKADNFYYILYPLHLAIRHGMSTWPEPQPYVKKKKTAQDRMLVCVKQLLAEGANPSAKDHLGRSPLHLLSVLFDQEHKGQRKFQDQVATQLLFRSVLVDAPNHQGDTPLTSAAQAGATNLVRTLLEKRANPNIQVNAEEEGKNSLFACGTSPLWAAASNNRVSEMYLLLYYNAKIKASELHAAHIMHDATDDSIHQKLLKRVIATRL